MVTLVRRYRRVRQPAAAIRPSALAQELGCGLLLLPQYPGVNLAGSTSYLSTSGTASDITFESSHGRAYSNGSDVYATGGQLDPRDGYWFLFRGYISAVGTWGGLMSRSRNNGTTNGWAWYRTSSNNTLSVQNGSSIYNPRVLNDLLDNVPRTWVGLWRPGTTNNLELWRDGKQEMLANGAAAPDYNAGEGWVNLFSTGVSGAWSLMAHGGGVALQSEQAAELSVKPWLLLAPRRIFVPVSVGGTTHEATGSLSASAATVAGSANAVTMFTSTGALSAQAATLAGTAVHLTLHTSSGALDAQAATLSASANHVTVHASSGALTADAATVSGSASLAVGGTFSATGALTSQSATVAGTAAHYTLHAATGDLEAQAATLAGVATHLTLHTSTGVLVADPASVSGVAVHSGDGAEVVQPRTGAGKSRRQSQRVVVEIDGEDFIAESPEEAQAILDQAKEAAEEKAKVAIERATKARNRPTRKVMADARKALELPAISAPDLGGYAEEISRQIEDIYQSAIQTIEVAALLRKRELEEEDDEDILMLL